MCFYPHSPIEFSKVSKAAGYLLHSYVWFQKMLKRFLFATSWPECFEHIAQLVLMDLQDWSCAGITDVSPLCNAKVKTACSSVFILFVSFTFYHLLKFPVYFSKQLQQHCWNFRCEGNQVTNEAGCIVTKINCVNSSTGVFNLWKCTKFQTMVLSVLTLFSILGFFVSFWRRVLPPLSGLLSAQRSSFEQHLPLKPVNLYLNFIITNKHKIYVYLKL